MAIKINGTVVTNDDKWIYDLFGIEAVCPNDVATALNSAKGLPVDVEINSGGGDVFSGAEIYSLLRGYKGGISIHITGIAGSIASVIACAGKCDISPVGTIMIHNVSGGARGDYNVMEKTAETLKVLNRTIVSAYTAKCGKDEDELLNLMNKETWLTAKEAVEMGLCDKITESQAEKVNFNNSCATIIPNNIIEKMKNQRFKDILDNDCIDRDHSKGTNQLELELELIKLKEVL